MLSVNYAECQLCLVSVKLSVTNKPVVLSVVMLNVVAPDIWVNIKISSKTFHGPTL
jgi:hypothetical protein